MTKATNKSGIVLLLILGALTSFAPLSVDMYLPSLPTLVRVYGTNEAQVQLTLSAFLLGFAFAQLIHGPLSDRFGRKPIVCAGIILYVLATVGAALSDDVETMISMRFLQAVGGSAGPVLARAMVRDLFPKNESARILSLLMLIMGAAPMLAPWVGGQILVFFGWQTIFWFLAGFGLLCLLLVVTLLAESHPVEARTSHNALQMINAYGALARNRSFIGHALCSGFGFAGMFSYISGSPFVFIDVYGFSEQTFGLLFGVNVLALMLGSAANARLVGRYGSERMLTVGCMLSAFMGLLMAFTVSLDLSNPLALLVPLFLFMPSVMITGANAMAGGLAIFPDRAGTAAAFMGATQFAIGAGAGSLVGLFHDSTPLPMALIIATCGILNLLSRSTLVRSH